MSVCAEDYMDWDNQVHGDFWCPQCQERHSWAVSVTTDPGGPYDAPWGELYCLSCGSGEIDEYQRQDVPADAVMTVINGLVVYVWEQDDEDN